MPEVQEVFRMSTQKVKPDPGALERQLNRQRRRSAGRKLAAFAVAAAFALGVIGLFLITRPGSSSTTTPAHESPSGTPIAHLSKPFFLDLPTGKTTPLRDNLTGGYAYVPSPDGTQLVYGAKSGGGCSKSADTTVASITGVDSRVLQAPGALAICGPRWSPYGDSLVYQLRNGASPYDVGNLFVQDLTTGRTTQLTHLDLTQAWWWYLAPSFTSDGLNVLFQLPRSPEKTTKWDVWSVPVTGGEPTKVLRNATFPMSNRHGPEGWRIAFLQPTSSNFAGRSLMAGRPSLETDLRWTLAESNSIWWPTLSPDGSRIAYQTGGAIYVVAFADPKPTKVAYGGTAEWLDDHTLIVVP
jgi:Tol biopolymer transport system component